MKTNHSVLLKSVRNFTATICCTLGGQTASAQLGPDDLLAYWDFDSVGSHTALTAGQGKTSPDARDLTLRANAAITADAGGTSGTAGDYGLELGTVNDGSNAKTAIGDHFDDRGSL